MFAASGVKLDLNNSSVETLSAALRPALLDAGVALSDMQGQEVATNIENYRNKEKSGLLTSFDELSSVKGVTPQIIDALKKECVLGPFTIRSAGVVGPESGAGLQKQGTAGT